MKIKLYNFILLMLVLLSACKDNNMDSNKPIAKFDVEIDKLHIKLVNNSSDADSYYWDLGNGVNSNLESLQFTYEKSGNYKVLLVAANDNGVYDKVVNIVSVTNKENGLEAMFSNEQVDNLVYKFINESIGAISYQWDFGDGNFSNDESPIHEYSNYGTYKVRLEAKNSNGDTDVLEQEILVRKKPVKIIIDSDFGEWIDVENIYETDETLKSGLKLVKVAHDDNYIYMYVETFDNLLASPFAIFIDRDCDVSTGWLDFWNSPADFHAEGTLFNSGTMWSNIYTGENLSSSWSWLGIDPITLIRHEGGGYKQLNSGSFGVEFAIDKSTIPDLNNDYFDFALKIRTSAWQDINGLPSFGKKYKMLRYSYDDYSLKIIE